MSKNLFRKGLVAVALTGLATTALAGTPAFAAGEITIAPSAGTSYNTFVTQNFELKTSFAPGFVPASDAVAGQLKYQVTTDGVATILATAGTTAGVTASGSLTLNSSNVAYVNSSATVTSQNYLALKVSGASATTTSTSVKVVAFADANNNGALDAGEWQTSAVNVGFKKYSEVTATTTITAPVEGDTSATAKVSFDGLNNEELTASLAGATFTKGDDTSIVTGTAASTPTAASISGTGAATVVTFTAANSFKVGQVVTVAGYARAATTPTTTVANINGTFAVTAASATSFSYASANADLGTGGTAVTVTFPTVSSAGGAVANVAWSSTDSFKYSIATSTLVKNQAVKVAPAYNGTAVGTAVTAMITARTLSALNASGVSGTTQSTNTVSLNKGFNAYAQTMDTTTPTAVAVAGKTVTYTVTAAALPATASAVTSSTATLTINGVTYTNQAALPGATGVAALSGVTNADGKVLVAGSTTAFTNGQTVVFSFTAENFTTPLTLTEATAVASAAYITNYQGNAAAVASGTSVAVNVSAVDQFGAAIADGYDVRARWASSTRTTTATTNTTAAVVAAVVGGKATLNLPDAGAGTGTNVWTLDIIKRDPTTGVYTGVSQALDNAVDFTGLADTTTFTVNFKAAADLVAGKVALSDSASTALSLNSDSTKYVYTAGVLGGATALADLSTATFGAYDARNVVGTVPAPFTAAQILAGSAPVVLNGVVSSASTATYAGVVIPGTTVTIAGAGLQFKAVQGGADVWATGSITVNADNNGAFQVSVYSNKAGAQTVTITSGAAKSVVDLNYKGAAADKGVTPVITAPATVVPGSTFSVSALFADKFGNVISSAGGAGYMTPATTATFKLSVSTGVGSTFADVTATGTDGIAKGNITTGSGDNGVITVTATYDADGAGTAFAAVTATATVKVAAPAAAKTAVAVGASQAQVGAAVDVTATATDAAGKPAAGVVVSFTVAGQGYLSTATATTNAAGVASVKLVSNVAGMNTVSAAANGSAAATTAVTFGNADANISFSKSKHTAIVNYEFAGNAKVVVSVNGARVKTVYPADDMVGSIKVSLKKGKNKVTVSVAGVVTDARTVTTK